MQRRVAAGVLSAGHARALLALDAPDAQEQLATRIVAEGLSVRAVEEIVAVGVTEPTARPGRAPRPVAPAVTALAELLSEQLETRVGIDLGRRRGKIVIQFASLDDLERIVAVIAPDAAGLLRAGDRPDAAPPEPESHPSHEQHSDGEATPQEWGHDEHGHDEHGHDEHGHG